MRKKLIARREDQQVALTSPLRQEMLEHLFATGPTSLAEIAERIGRAPNGLYYHAGILEGAGLIRRAGTRRVGRRDEVLYELAATTIEIPEPKQREARERALKTIRTAFKRAEREFAAGFEDARTTTHGPGRGIVGFRARAFLRPAALAQLNEHLDAIVELMRSELGRAEAGTPFAVTVALTPSP